MNVYYKKTAIDDIRATESYISQKLHNTVAAKKLTRNIIQAVSRLSAAPYMGTPLRSKYEVDTDLRFLIVSKHLIFYRVVEAAGRIEVTRVIDGRRDYMAILFTWP